MQYPVYTVQGAFGKFVACFFFFFFFFFFYFFYLSNRFTIPIMFGIILKNYLTSMLGYKFMRTLYYRHEDLLLVCILEKAKVQ